jgi:hypothetical protein
MSKLRQLSYAFLQQLIQYDTFCHHLCVELSTQTCSLIEASLSPSSVNTSGVPRLTKFYTPIHQAAQTIVSKIYSLISTRPPSSCNFLEAPELDELLGRKDVNERLHVVYRSYATLHFVFVVDQSESELGMLDLIQVRTNFLSRGQDAAPLERRLLTFENRFS